MPDNPTDPASVVHCLTATCLGKAHIGRGLRLTIKAALPSPKQRPRSISVSATCDRMEARFLDRRGVRWCLVAGRQQATDAGSVGRYTPRSNHHARRLAETQTRHRTSSQRLHTDHGANDCCRTIAKRCRRRHVMVSSVESVPVVNGHRRNAR